VGEDSAGRGGRRLENRRKTEESLEFLNLWYMFIVMSNRNLEEAVVLGTALAVAPAAVGCALGILLGQRLGKRAGHAAASTIFAVGVVSVLPCAIDALARRLNGPGTTRGQARQQELIREGSLLLYEDVAEVDEERAGLREAI
jgi:hypothetical protein